jgi:hypothetical protein
MGVVSHWIISFIVILLVGGGAMVYIRRVLLRRDEAAAGIVALAAMSWREFVNLVLEALARRGYARVVDPDAPSNDGEYALACDGQRYLMSCKHGSTFVLGIPIVNELANDIRLRSAAGGLLVTQGHFAAEARKPAKLQRIELLDGATLWPEVRDIIAPERLAAIRAGAEQRARQRVLFAWLVALLAGIATFFLLPRSEAPAAPTTAPVAPQQPASPASAPETRDAGQAQQAPEAMDAATLEQQRKDVANAISTLPMVDRAAWSTQSTLEVLLLETESDAVAVICPLMERYPSLASSRVQLTPPQDSQAPIRFRQCRSY